MILSTRCDAGRPPLRAALHPRRRAAGALLAALLLGSSSAQAEEPARTDPVAAEALFKAGRDLLKQGDYAAGCPKFEASLALNPSASTMLNIARCHEHEGKVATAWHDYHRALVLNQETKGSERKRDLDDIASKGIAELEPRLPRLRIVLEQPPSGLKVTRDGKELPAGALGEALPADPGRHEITASAPGHKPVTRSVTLEEGKTETIELELERGGAAETPGEVEESGGAPAWAWVTGGVGLALIGGGIFFLVDDLSAISDLRAGCSTSWSGTSCAPGYDYASDNARKNRDFPLFLGLTGAGVVAVGIATYGILAAPRGPRSEQARTGTAVIPWVGREGAGATITGSF